ncbi:4'-phosphopantetheinyl transferase family protein [Tropicibacter oceani]|uniref:Enterobactin synthase component D n=1 Tax=Tropicibacter oceani TaxID=3058420 RepID=A0ABY8QIP2_9RHOB|nr:4'-phosphopantetheinyl transferase superfamily protein [Tropicibacter oceani]WGW04504.1 4'-phosphopantetheinyl transferase superfamily protein [Tropicibacter oceani]
MTPLAPDILPELTQGFLHPADLRREGQGVLVQGGYDLARFRLELFDQLEITRPAKLARAIDKRLAEFLAGRAMARVAQGALGIAGQVAIGDDRAPVWPDGLAGSISHARGRCACLALPQGQGTPGIDIEAIAHGHALESILRMTLNDAETALIGTASQPDTVATLCFSAKETLFKALYPVVRRHFGFASARLQALPRDGVLRLTLAETLHPDLPQGRSLDLRYDTGKGHVLTWLVHQSP